MWPTSQRSSGGCGLVGGGVPGVKRIKALMVIKGSQAVEMVVGWVGEVCKRTSQSERFQHPIDTSILEHAIMPFLGIDRVESVRLGGQNKSFI